MREIDIITTFSDSIVNIKSFEFKGLNLYRLFLNYYFAEYYEQDFVKSKSVINQKSKEKDRIGKIKKISTVIWYLVQFILMRYRKRFLYVDTNSKVIEVDNKTYDLYNYKFINYLSPDSVLSIVPNTNRLNKIHKPKFFLDKIFFVHYFIIFHLRFFPIDKYIVTFTEKCIKENPNFVLSYSEIINILKNYYYNYLKWVILLKILNPKYLFTPDSGDESMIAACKKQNIPFVELQHGNINGNHYLYSSKMSCNNDYLYNHGLCADKVAVWGEYWKKSIIDGGLYPDRSIIVMGDYRFIPFSSKVDTKAKKMILISTQWTVQTELIDYITFLSQNLSKSEYYIIIEPHPFENKSAYNHLEIPGFIYISDKNVYENLAMASIHISVYSTLIFEAIKYPLTNYALYIDKFKVYIDEIINSGVAQLLMPFDLPIIKPRMINNQNYFFETFPTKEFIAYVGNMNY